MEEYQKLVWANPVRVYAIMVTVYLNGMITYMCSREYAIKKQTVYSACFEHV